MKLSNLDELRTSRVMTDTFRGYNHNSVIPDGQFFDMKNFSSDGYPLLQSCPRHGTYNPHSGYTPATSVQGMIQKDSLCYVDGATLYINGYAVTGFSLSTATNMVPKTLVSMGAYLIILPDKKYINTKDYTDKGDIEASVTTSSNVTYSLCDIEGNAITATASATEPDISVNYWIDTSSAPHTLKQWSVTMTMWVSVATTYVKIAASGIGAPFAQYDGVNISGIEPTQLADIAEPSATIWARDDDWIVVIGIIDETVTQSAAVTVSRKMPDLDFICENENRLWGCRYGLQNGVVVNEIYACKLGDFKNWNSYMGTSMDSYVASCGTDGQFTGAITHLGYPCFFKENCLHKVYGNYPSNFQIQATALKGVQKGCDKSLAIVNGTLYYKSRLGVCSYDGSLPTEIDAELGEYIYDSAIGCAHDNKYYLSMHRTGTAGTWDFLCYDQKKRQWHRIDGRHMLHMCSVDDELYYVDSAHAAIRTEFGSGTKDSDKVEWMAETGIIGNDTPNHKIVSRLNIRLALEVGGRVSISAEYDSLGGWERITTFRGNSLRTYSLTIKPRRCDHFRLKFDGEGDVKIFSITKAIEQESDYGNRH